MQALQNNSEVILNVMDVFVKEPLIDWEKLAARVAREQDPGTTAGGQNVWFPKKKIEIAKRKLHGDNPAYILVDELRSSIHASKPYIKALEDIAKGDKQTNYRAKVGAKCSSVMEQVTCLVDQATDPNVLGRTYWGWAPWVTTRFSYSSPFDIEPNHFSFL